MRRNRPISIRVRILVLVLACEVALVTAMGFFLHHYQSRQLTTAFDSALTSNAEALATMLGFEEDDDQLSLEFSDEVMTRFSRKDVPDLFAVYGPNAQLLESSTSLKEIPSWIHSVKKTQTHDFEYNGNKYRGILLATRAEVDDDSEKTYDVTVFFAAGSDGLANRLERSAASLIYLSAAFFVLSAAMIWWAVGRGLATIDNFESEAQWIGARTLNRRFQTDQFPIELQGLAVAFNALLSRLEAAFETEQKFSADAAHELRTPVASIKATIQSALLQGSANTHVQSEILNDLLLETDRLESLCESLLQLSRAELAPSDRETCVMSFAQIEQEVHNSVPAEGALAVSFRSPSSQTSDALQFRTSPVVVHRISSNIIRNFLSHAGLGAKLSVSFQKSVTGLEVVFEDDGVGIPESSFKFLFVRFGRLDSHRARTSGGAGLGLSICKALAERDGGVITFEPNTPRGSRFRWMILAA